MPQNRRQARPATTHQVISLSDDFLVAVGFELQNQHPGVELSKMHREFEIAQHLAGVQ